MPISADPSGGATVVGRLAVVLFRMVLAAVGIMHFWSVFTQNVNWDEFALLNRAVGTLQSGDVLGGGRPVECPVFLRSATQVRAELGTLATRT